MPQQIYKLFFRTPVHFGVDEGGSTLVESRMTFRCDTLFSALYTALQPVRAEEALLQAVKDGRLRFSDAFPFCGERLFLPKPFGALSALENTDEAEDPSHRKRMKRIAYIPLDRFRQYLAGKADAASLGADFGERFESTRVNCGGKEPLPYRVGGFRFAETCGLYVIAGADETALELFESGLDLLQATGVGGRISAGWGKFTWKKEPVETKLHDMLEDTNAKRQMLLATACPAACEMAEALTDASYMTVRRGGFTQSAATRPRRKRTMFALDAGSTFTKRFSGDLVDVGVNMPHPVWRYGYGLFAGVEM